MIVKTIVLRIVLPELHKLQPGRQIQAHVLMRFMGDGVVRRAREPPRDLPGSRLASRQHGIAPARGRFAALPVKPGRYA